MGFFQKLRKAVMPHAKAALTGGLSLLSRKERSRYRKSSKSLRKPLGLTGKRLKHLLGRSALVSPVATSAYTEGYRYHPRTLSQLTGGV